MNTITWYKMWCPKCDVVNWIDNGDTSDLSVIDVEGCECHACGHVWLFNEELSEEMNRSTDIEDMYIEKGLETPS